MELHVRTRKSLNPDPEFDPICAIFYHIEHETTQGKQYETGIIVVQNEYTKLRKADLTTSSNTVLGVRHIWFSCTVCIYIKYTQVDNLENLSGYCN